jgi:hypothetical protein
LLVSIAFLQALHFEPVQPELFGAGANFTNAWADYDGDSDPDLFVGFDGTPNRLYRNDRGVFTDVAAAAGVADARSTRAAAWGDFDADGDPDLLVGFTPASAAATEKSEAAATAGKPADTQAKPANSVLRLYRNDGGKFVDHTAPAGLVVEKGAVRQPAFIDFDGDNDLDLFIAFRDRPNALFRNDPVPSPSVSRTAFRDVAAEVGVADTRRTVGAVWFDFDQDGDFDLAVANMDGDANGLFRNDGGKFTDIAETAGIAWGGRKQGDKTNGTVRVCAADVNNDGRFDLFFANYGKNGLFLNGTGTPAFNDVSAAWGIDNDARYDACVFDDFDNDGRIDLYVNGTVTGGVSYPDFLFRNMGDRFADVTPQRLKVLHADHGVQWADYDNDGDVDLALTGAQPSGMHSLFANMLGAEDAARSLKVRVVDRQKRATRAGAEVRVLAAGTSRVLAARLVDTGSGYDSQNDLPVHIGLASMAAVDIEVVFPRGGKRATAKQTRVDPRGWRNKTLTIQIE